MVQTIIDNATVSSVQRALGLASIRNSSLLDVEHTALARFSEAVLLSERVIIPDNYKETLTPKRKALLSDDVFSFQKLDEPQDKQINEICSSLLEIWQEAFHAGVERGLFSQYFLQVDAFSKFIWEHSSSEFFLVFRALGIQKNNPLIDAVLASKFDETIGTELGKNMSIYAPNGQPVSWERLSNHVQRMLSVMGWLGHQYLWYQILSASLDCYYMPHPLRDFFAYDFLNRVNSGAKSFSNFSAVMTKGIGDFQGKAEDLLKELTGNENAATIKLPTFLPLLVKESTGKKDFLTVLSQMRTEKRVAELRGLLVEAQTALDRGDYKPISKIKQEIEAVGDGLLAQLGLKGQYLKITPPTGLLGIKIEGEATSLKCRISPILYKQFFLGRRYRAFVKSAMEELAMPSKYGDLKTKLNGWAWIKPDPFQQNEDDVSAFYLKGEQPRSKFHKKFQEADEEFSSPL